tara:strand:- start:262 stop:651 length:390 start_codon:yes stop_codon:yes gene_type:complete
MSDTKRNWLLDDKTIYTLKSNGTNDFWFQVNRSGYSENHVREFSKEIVDKLNNHDKLTSRVAELEFSLDDRDCYIADADMKNEELTKQVAELRSVVYEANKYLDINNLTTIGSGSKLHEWFKQALKESE